MSDAFQPKKWVGEKYSPNLNKWLAKNQRHRAPSVFRWQEGGFYIGWREDDDWFSGTRLRSVLCDGRKAQVYAHVPSWGTELILIPDFWERYAKIGRCAIDEDHTTAFIGDQTRWAVVEDTRECLWCGDCRQILHRWQETVDHQAWKPNPSIEAEIARLQEQEA